MRPPAPAKLIHVRSRRAAAVGSVVAACLVLGLVPAQAAPVIVAAGDIACPSSPCDSHRGTAALIGRIDPRAVLTLGDNQYNEGALADFRASYHPTWGRFKGRTFPSPGNHEYQGSSAGGYFSYFGQRAHRQRGGFYSFNIGRWHLISVNSGDGAPSQRRLDWIARNLRRDRHRCELVYWHHPRWSSGTEHGSDSRMSKLWSVLFKHGVDVVLNGHEHNYERFALMAPSGKRSQKGIREFVVGTGGRGHYGFGSPERGSQVRIGDRFGVLRMELRRSGYGWKFISTNPRMTRDRGNQRCHA
ncbi:MAG: metallophosphoesterase [Actinomycetota bacterium]|nr:metallophosphoesterase [Actinomycetota bacterium]MDH5224628.1 metallophosphoesterase [Actinomycetota bacterium]MDH5313021.1 metallophosphoesterase [Actinomycetota bacterium]